MEMDMEMKSSIAVFTNQYEKQANSAVEQALTDVSEGAKERAAEKAFIWTKLDTEAYS
jgi:hypothetical protein